MHLPYISHVSPYISVPGAAAELWRADGLGGFYSSYGSNYAYSTPVYISPISPLYLPYGSNYAYSTPVYISPISPLYLPYGSNYAYSTPVDAIKLLLNLHYISPIFLL